MEIKFLIVFLLWYGVLSIAYLDIFAYVDSDAEADYDFSDDLNSTGFSQDEIDTGGFFSGIVGITTAVGRFFGFIGFGFGMPSDTPGWVSTFIILWNTCITMVFIAWIVNCFWNPG